MATHSIPSLMTDSIVTANWQRQGIYRDFRSRKIHGQTLALDVHATVCWVQLATHLALIEVSALQKKWGSAREHHVSQR
jgi:hypothetical protein